MKARDFRWFNTKYTTRFLYVSMYVSRANDSILLRSICKTDLFPHSFLPSPISIYVSPVAFVGLLTLFYLINEIDVAGVRGVVAWRGLERERWYLVVALLLIFLPTGTNILQKLKYLLLFLRPFVWPFFVAILLMFRMRPMLRKRSRAIQMI